jgi:hypothetical protein
VPDPQIIELLGRNLLVEELLRAGLEVAFPLRDRGIDLIAYEDTGEGVAAFSARPIQMKAASDERFNVDCKYKAFPGLIIAFVWSIGDSVNTVTYALTYEDLIAVADAMGYTQTPSWENGRYASTNIGGKLRALLEAHRMTPAKWQDMVTGRIPQKYGEMDGARRATSGE